MHPRLQKIGLWVLFGLGQLLVGSSIGGGIKYAADRGIKLPRSGWVCVLGQQRSHRGALTAGSMARQSNAKILKKSVEWENLLGYLGGNGSEGHIRNFGWDVFVCAPPKAWAMAVVGMFFNSKFWKTREAVVFKRNKQRPPPPAAGAARSRRKQVSGQASK